MGARFLTTPGGGMSMWPPLFLWLIIIEQCWPGVLKLYRSEVPGIRGAGMPTFLKKSLCPAGGLTNSWKIMLSSLLVDNWATKEDASRG